MRITAISALTGPSIFGMKPVIRCVLELGEVADWPGDRLGEGFVDTFFDCLPALRESEDPSKIHQQGSGLLPHLLMLAAVDLQKAAGADVEIGAVRPIGPVGVYHVAYGYEEAEIGVTAGRLALALIQQLLPEPSAATRPKFDFTTEREKFIAIAQQRGMAIESRYLVKAANARDIPWVHLGNNYIQFGQGRLQRLTQKKFTDQTSFVGVNISRDKALTNRILGTIGLPVPKQLVVRRAEEAVRAAERIDYPVVVKPFDTNFGIGVSVRLSDAEKVRAAFSRASKFSRTIIVEMHIQGDDHRMLVINGDLVATAKRIPGHIVGDGKSTVEELVEELNRDPRRGAGMTTLMKTLKLDDQADRLLAEVGYSRESIPKSGEVVYLRGVSNLSAGGSSVDMTDTVHPDNKNIAEQAVKAIGLDVSGVDFITPDISRSYRDVGGAICEINPTPALSPHLAAEGVQRDVAGPILDMLFPPGTHCRIPIATIAGIRGATSAAGILAHILKQAGHTVGLSSSGGVYIGGDHMATGTSGPAAARMILRNPTVDVAIIETSAGELLRHGLGFESCDVAAVLDASSQSSQGSAANPEELIEALGVLIEASRGVTVINADDDLCLGMVKDMKAECLFLASMNADHSPIKTHIDQGGDGAFLEQSNGNSTLSIQSGGNLSQIEKTDILGAGAAAEHMQSIMFASAMAFNLGRSAEDIRHALLSFDFGSL